MNTKKISIFLFLILASLSVYGTNTVIGNDSLLFQIQDKIYDAFLHSFQDNSPKHLIDIGLKIKDASKQNQIALYWFAYAKYYESIYYLKNEDRRKASKELDSAVSILEDVKSKNTEVYALLAFLQSFSIQFSGGMSSGILSNKAKKNAETALMLDSTNLRAWYVLASNDYYTPSAFGGGKKCEEYLLKAINLNEQTIANPYMPGWGKSDAYVLLIGYYIGNEDFMKAKEYLNTALFLYPDNHMIKQYVDTLKNK